MLIIERLLAQKNIRVLYLLCGLNHNVRNYINNYFDHKLLIKTQKNINKYFLENIDKYDKYSYKRKIVSKQLPEKQLYFDIKFIKLTKKADIFCIEKRINQDFMNFIENYYNYPHPNIVLVAPQNIKNQLMYVKNLYLSQNKTVYIYLFLIKSINVGIFFDLVENCYFTNNTKNSTKKYMFIGEILDLLRLC